jgi:hypothetical protein
MLLLFFVVTFQNLHAQKTPLRRANSFFGLHFDFHASKNDTLVGKTLTEGMIDTLLSTVKPDFIQVDSKGHPGITSYPTKVPSGTHVKSFEKDPLVLFRKVTRKYGVALYVHYSGVWDDAALVKHPEWAAVDTAGIASKQKTSVHSQYVDKLLIPQLKEIADYGIDGVWVDGDCWAAIMDYSPTALQKFKQKTGISVVPKSVKDDHYQEFKDFNRQSFLDYVGHYTNELHQYKPTFQVASNWAFSSFMPEPVSLNVDFMSGDLQPMNGVGSAQFESRILATQSRVYKKPWDLMSWGFNTKYDDNSSAKTALNLNQEVAEVIATGGSYQCYFTQNNDASIRVQQVKTMAEIAKFARQRQAFTQGAVAIPQIALLNSLASYKKFNHKVYSNSLIEPTRGVLGALLDAQNAVEIVSEHHIKGGMNKYPLIVIPEWDYLEEDFLQELKNYVKDGGNLLVIGSGAVNNFREELGIELVGKSKKERFWVNVNQALGLVNGSLQNVKLNPDNQVFSNYYLNEDTRFPKGVSASWSNYGKGKMAGVYFNFGESYYHFQSPELRDFLNQIVSTLFPSPMVKISGSKLIHVTVNNLKGKTTVNLINSGGPYNSNKIVTYDELPPLYNLDMSIKLAQKPQKITQQPENISLPFTWQNGTATVKIPKLEIHSIVVVD